MTDTYGVLFREWLHPTWEHRVRRRPTLLILDRLRRSQWASEDELLSMQSFALKKLVAHAWESTPYYRQRFEAAGLAPSDISRVEDIDRIPLLSRADAASSFAARCSRTPPLVEIRKMTSGTSGSPLQFGYDLGSEHWREATRLRGYSWAGYCPGDRSLHFWGSLAAVQHQPLGHRAKVAVDHLLKREHFIDCTDRSPEALEHALSVLSSLRPVVLVCYAQAGAALARHAIETGRAPLDVPVICGAERLFPADREKMVRAFGRRVFETYGSREVMLMAAECEAHDGMHVSMENLVVELIVRDGEAERAARPGEVGEVVVTDLHNYGAPFIRYVTGDLAVRMPAGRCACGRGLARLSSIEGRRTETLVDGEGRAVSGLFFNVMFSVMADTVRQFQVVQRRDRSIDLSIVPTSALDESVLRGVRESCAKFLPGVELRIDLVSEIPVGPGGKLHVVRVEGA